VCGVGNDSLVDGLQATFKGIHMAPTSGTIKRITDKGFGFIATPEGTEYFFHNSACTSTPFDSMREGENVTFTIGQGPKGPRAENVKLA
jgi:cold shock protein